MIRPLREDEFPLVEEWRNNHFAYIKSNLMRPVVGQRGFTDAFWVCLDRKGVPIAACSFTDEGPYRFVHDLYGAPGDALAALALAEVIEQMCDEQKLELRGNTDPENTHFLKVLQRRGYELTAVGFRRPPKPLLESPGRGTPSPAQGALGGGSLLEEASA